MTACRLLLSFADKGLAAISWLSFYSQEHFAKDEGGICFPSRQEKTPRRGAGFQSWRSVTVSQVSPLQHICNARIVATIILRAAAKSIAGYDVVKLPRPDHTGAQGRKPRSRKP
jgi:hypothetical protein